MSHLLLLASCADGYSAATPSTPCVLQEEADAVEHRVLGNLILQVVEAQGSCRLSPTFWPLRQSSHDGCTVELAGYIREHPERDAFHCFDHLVRSGLLCRFGLRREQFCRILKMGRLLGSEMFPSGKPPDFAFFQSDLCRVAEIAGEIRRTHGCRTPFSTENRANESVHAFR